MFKIQHPDFAEILLADVKSFRKARKFSQKAATVPQLIRTIAKIKNLDLSGADLDDFCDDPKAKIALDLESVTRCHDQIVDYLNEQAEFGEGYGCEHTNISDRMA